MTPRSLQISPRPFIAFGIVLAPVVVICALAVVKQGFRRDLLLLLAMPFLIYTVLMLPICSNKVTVTETGLSLVSFFLYQRRIPFSCIDHTEIQILAEPDHPAWLTVHYRESQKLRTLNLSLKPYRKQDVAWFCALPELKPKVYRGFTKN